MSSHTQRPEQKNRPPCSQRHLVLTSKEISTIAPMDSFSFCRTFAGNAMKCVPSPIGSMEVGQLEAPDLAVIAINPRSARCSSGLLNFDGTGT